MTVWASGDLNDYYALRVAVGKERRVQAILDNRGIENKVPMREYASKSRYVSNPAPVQRPALSGFVFIAFDKAPMTEQPWHLLSGLHMVFGPVGIRKTPVRLDHAGLARLFEDLVFSDMPKPPVYEAGQEVKVVIGPFAGFPATVVEAGETELRLLTFIFGRATPVAIPMKNLDWIEHAQAA